MPPRFHIDGILIHVFRHSSSHYLEIIGNESVEMSHKERKEGKKWNECPSGDMEITSPYHILSPIDRDKARALHGRASYR